MKRWYIIGGIIAIVVAVGIYLTRFASHAKRLFVDVSSVKPVAISSMTDLLGGFKLNVGVLLKNFSPTGYNVEQMKINLYTTTENGTTLASQPAPLQEAKYVEANKNTTLDMEFDANINGFADLLINQVKEVNSWDEALSRLMNWVTTGKLGVTVRAKGFVVAEGVKIDIDQKVDI